MSHTLESKFSKFRKLTQRSQTFLKFIVIKTKVHFLDGRRISTKRVKENSEKRLQKIVY